MSAFVRHGSVVAHLHRPWLVVVQLWLLLMLTVAPRGHAADKFPLPSKRCDVWKRSDNKSLISITCENLVGNFSIADDLKYLNTVGETRGSFIVVGLNVTNSSPENVNAIFSGKPKIVMSEQLTELTLSGCRLQSLPNNLTLSSLLQRYPMLERLDLSNNALTELGEPINFAASNRTKFRLDRNNWNCDTSEWLQAAFNHHPHLFERSNDTRCALPENIKGASFMQARSLKAWINNAEICALCQCYAINAYQYLAVNCSALGLKEFPRYDLPNNTKIVYLNDNDIEKINAPTSSGWSSLLKLYLRNNTIGTAGTMDALESLTHATFGNLRTLDLSSNRLSENIPLHLLENVFKQFDELKLGDNPWTCDCAETVVFRDWIMKHAAGKQVDIENIRCSNDRLENNARNGISASPTAVEAQFAGEKIYRIARSDLCPQSGDPIELLDIICAALGALTVLIILKLIYDWRWQKRTGKLPKFFKINI